jgi:hypothetical protein
MALQMAEMMSKQKDWIDRQADVARRMKKDQLTHSTATWQHICGKD